MTALISRFAAWFWSWTQPATPDIWFTSLGLVVLDQLEFPDKKLSNVIGGSGTYAILGARLFRPPPASSSIGWLLRLGDDFPEDVRLQLESWGCSTVYKQEVDRPSTRGRLSYKDELGTKTFEYLTPPLPILPSHLTATPLLQSRSFHLLSTPGELLAIIAELLSLREKADIRQRPLIVWEPRPASCVTEDFSSFSDAAKHVDIFSPNHIEFAQIFDAPNPEVLDKHYLERHAELLLECGVGHCGKGAVLLRAGETGCMVASREQLPRWVPPFYDGESTIFDNGKMDPTGAGNAFLGAFAIGFLETSNLAEAACYGNIGGSFALEQTGLPLLQSSSKGETWNGASVRPRLAHMKDRLG
jgi:sugar/nucleoside kinase (ribokinase family)